MRRSRSTASSSTSSRRGRPWRSCWRGRERSRPFARRWARRIQRTPAPGRFAAISRCRCPTTWSTARTLRSRPRARSRSGLTDYLERNRRAWTKSNAEYTDDRAPEAWAADEITWGMFGPSDSELGVLGDVSGKDVIELGCGTAYFGAWLAKRGARVTGVDITPAQLETARRM